MPVVVLLVGLRPPLCVATQRLRLWSLVLARVVGVECLVLGGARMPRGQKPPSCRWVGTRAACTGAAALTPSGSGQARAAWGQHGAGAPPPALAPLSFPLGRGSTRTRGCGCACNIQSPGGGFTSSVVWRSPLAVVMRLLGCEWLGRLFDLNAGILLNLGLIAGILLNLGKKLRGTRRSWSSQLRAVPN